MEMLLSDVERLVKTLDGLFQFPLLPGSEGGMVGRRERGWRE